MENTSTLTGSRSEYIIPNHPNYYISQKPYKAQQPPLNYPTTTPSGPQGAVQQAFIVPIDIVGTAEVAELLKCPKQQVYTLRRRADFPKPIRTVAATPLWDANDIIAFAKTWKRRKKNV